MTALHVVERYQVGMRLGIVRVLIRATAGITVQGHQTDWIVLIVTQQLIAEDRIGVIVGGTEAGLGSHLAHGLHDRVPSGLQRSLIIFVIARFITDREIIQLLGIVIVDILRQGSRRSGRTVLQSYGVDHLRTGSLGKTEEMIHILSGGCRRSFLIDRTAADTQTLYAQCLEDAHELGILLSKIILTIGIGTNHTCLVAQSEVVLRNYRTLILIVDNHVYRVIPCKCQQTADYANV